MTKQEMAKVLKAEAKVINEMYENQLSPSDFSEEEYLDSVYDCYIGKANEDN